MRIRIPLTSPVPAVCAGLFFVSSLAAQRSDVPFTPGAERGPVTFTENAGQWHEDVRFRSRRGPFTAWFHARGWTISARRIQDRREVGTHARLSFEGSRAVTPVGEHRLDTTRSYFLGKDPKRWASGVAGYGRLRYRELYEGIDVIVRSAGERPEYDVRVRPGADLSKVVVRCEGIDDLDVAQDGALIMRSRAGDLRQTPPTTWYVRGDGSRELVRCRFRRIDAQRYGFIVDQPRLDLELVVDPGFVWATYLGGNGGDDRVYSVKLADNGLVVVAGATNSTDFPTSLGAYSKTHGGARDAFVACFDRSKSGAAQLVYCTLLGGTGDDWCYDVQPHADGRLTLCGNSISADFPTTSNAYQPKLAGDRDGVFVELDTTRTGAAQLRYATYIGGPGRDFVNSHRMVGEVVTLLGETAGGMPIPATAFQSKYGGGSSDVFVTRLNTGKQGAAQLEAATYLGGADADGNRADFVDRGADFDLDEMGGAVIVGRTRSTDFPTTVTAIQSGLQGVQSGFVARLDRDMRRLAYGSYLGGSGADALNDMHYDGHGRLTAVGYAGGTGFPVSANAYQKDFAGGNSDLVIVRVDTRRPGAAGLSYSTYLGSGADATVTSTERARGVAVEPSGMILVGGFVGTTKFPTTRGALKETPGGGVIDAIVARIDPRRAPAAQLIYSTYMPGSLIDVGLDLALDGVGGCLVAGSSSSTDFGATSGAFDTTVATGRDGYVGQLDLLPTGVAKIGDGSRLCGREIYSGVTAQPRSGAGKFGMFCNNAPAWGRGVLLLGAPSGARRIGGVTVFVDLGKPMVTIPVQANGDGYAEVELPQALIPTSKQAFQFLFLSPPRCGGSAVVTASQALSF